MTNKHVYDDVLFFIIKLIFTKNLYFSKYVLMVNTNSKPLSFEN